MSTATTDRSHLVQPRNDPAGEPVSLLDAEGVRRSDSRWDPWLDGLTDDAVRRLYEDMVVVRRLDVEATALQRQGELGLWPPLLGQEAAQIGSARALEPHDFAFSSYRENGVAYCRGVQLPDLLRVWRGTDLGGWNPFEVGMAIPAVVIGAQTLHATGYALAAKRDGADAVAIAYFGDGATSQGDVNEAMVFAASFQAPVVFFCQNNQWAISEPVGLQAQRPIAERAPGFGIPSVRVDGNDVLAVVAVTRSALDRARSGAGPTFIEAVTYRMGPHTTSDDPSRYVDPAQRELWMGRDPLRRVENYLRSQGALSESDAEGIQSAADAAAAELRAGCHALEDPQPLTMFDNVYATPHAGVERQRSHYAAYLAGFERAESQGGAS